MNLFLVLSVTFPWHCFTALLVLMRHSMLYISEEDKNEKGATADSVQQRRQYRRQNQQSSSGYKRFYPCHFFFFPSQSPFSLTKSLSMSFCPHRLMDFWSCVLTPNLAVFSFLHTVKATSRQLLMSSASVVSDSGSSSSEDEGPKRSTTGPGARNGEVRRRRSRTPSPRRRHRDASPRSDTKPSVCTFLSDWFSL